jgi:DNA-binding CsgD family transcriptional regulator
LWHTFTVRCAAAIASGYNASEATGMPHVDPKEKLIRLTLRIATKSAKPDAIRVSADGTLRSFWLDKAKLKRIRARESRTAGEIAYNLRIGARTVLETHHSGIMRKLNVSSAAALVRYAVRAGIVEP